MRSGRKFWFLAAAAAVIIVVVVLVVVLTSSSGPSGTPTPTPTYTAPPGPTATRTVGPNQTDTCNIYFNTSSCTIGKGETVALMVVIDDVDYLASGQFDVLYDNGIISLFGEPTSGVIHDTVHGDIAIDTYYNLVESGRLRVFVDCTWAQTDSGGEPSAGGDGTGPCGDGYLSVLAFKGMSAGTCEIAFGGKLQVNQIKDWGIYADYSYGATTVVWGPSVQVTVQ